MGRGMEAGPLRAKPAWGSTGTSCGGATAPGGSRKPKGEQKGWFIDAACGPAPGTMCHFGCPHEEFKPFLDPLIRLPSGQWDAPGVPHIPTEQPIPAGGRSQPSPTIPAAPAQGQQGFR